MTSVPDQPSSPVLLALYAAIESVSDGRVAEAEIEHRTATNREGVEHEEILTITVRRSVKLFQLGGGQVEGG